MYIPSYLHTAAPCAPAPSPRRALTFSRTARSSAYDFTIIPPVRERKGGRTETSPTGRRRGSPLQSIHRHKEGRKTLIIIPQKDEISSISVSVSVCVFFSLSPSLPHTRTPQN